MSGFETADTRCTPSRDGVMVLKLAQPRPSITSDVLDAIDRALDDAAREGAALVIAES